MAKQLSDKDVVYLKYAIDNDLPSFLKWIEAMFANIAEENYTDELISIQDGSFYVLQDEELVMLRKGYTEPLWDPSDTLDISPGFLINVTKQLTTTVGRVITNYIIGAKTLNGKIPYINEAFNLGDIENKYIVNMLTEDKSDKEGIQMEEYLDFINLGMYMDSMSKTISVSATMKSLVPAPGIDAYKKKLVAELVKANGEDILKDPKAISDLEAKLVAYDAEYLKGDPADGRLIGGKIKKVARKKMYISFGTGNAPGAPTPVLDSLTSGWKKDKEQLTAFNNDLRYGSYSRGVGTQMGGVISKIVLRATSDIVIKPGDCGTKAYLPTTVTKSNKSAMLNRYIVSGTKLILITVDNIDSYMGKEVNLRSPMYCHSAPNFCSICTGEAVNDHPSGIPLLTSTVGAEVLGYELSKFHGIEFNTAEIDLADFS